MSGYGGPRWRKRPGWIPRARGTTQRVDLPEPPSAAWDTTTAVALAASTLRSVVLFDATTPSNIDRYGGQATIVRVFGLVEVANTDTLNATIVDVGFYVRKVGTSGSAIGLNANTLSDQDDRAWMHRRCFQLQALISGRLYTCGQFSYPTPNGGSVSANQYDIRMKRRITRDDQLVMAVFSANTGVNVTIQMLTVLRRHG